MSHRFAVVGAGVGGLTLAIALEKKGFNVTVYEQAPVIKPLGAGLALAANAVKAFSEIGISQEVLKAGKVLKVLRIKDPKGNTLSETDAEIISAKLGVVNNFTIHRADLHSVLLSQLKKNTIQPCKSCINFIQKKSTIILQFQDGSEAETDYVIACDGIHSAIRKKLLPDSKPRYSGYTCWRAVIDVIPANINMDETSETWGAGTRFGIAPLTNNRIYWFACINAKENDPAMKSMKVESLLSHFKNFHFPVVDILNATKDSQLIWSDIIDIKPLKRFAFGNIVLMGDAAHATTPNMGQGACMAIEDAAVLAKAIETHSSVEDAFVYFEKKRIRRTTAIVNQSWRIGKIAQLENPLLIGMRNFAIKRTPSSVMEKQIDFLTNISF